MIKYDNISYFEVEDGVSIAYTTNFEAEDFNEDDILFVFNYGLVCSNEHWKYQVPYFDSNDIKILLHDYRFHHNSTGNDSVTSCTFDNISTDINKLVNHLGARKVLMLGHSMGVNISLEFAKRYPDMALGLVLISGTVVPPQNVLLDSNLADALLGYIKQLKITYPRIFEAYWTTQHINPLVFAAVHRGGFNIRRVSEDFVYSYIKNLSVLCPDLFFQLMDEMRDHNIANYVENMDTPALVIGGDQDHVIPSYLQRGLHDALKCSELYIVKDGSHVPQADFPSSVNERILQFYKKHCSI